MDKLFDILTYDCVTTIVAVAASTAHLRNRRCPWEIGHLAVLY